MQFTTVRLERPQGTVLARGIAVQIEAATASDLERVDSGGARPFDLFWVYTTQGAMAPSLRRRDTLFDEVNSDPETGLPARYRVAGMVESFDDHQEALCERVVGS